MEYLISIYSTIWNNQNPNLKYFFSKFRVIWSKSLKLEVASNKWFYFRWKGAATLWLSDYLNYKFNLSDPFIQHFYIKFFTLNLSVTTSQGLWNLTVNY
jgi:hypothetical protein